MTTRTRGRPPKNPPEPLDGITPDTRFTTNVGRCDVCGAVRPDAEIDVLVRDVGARFGINRALYFVVDHCIANRVCRESAEKRADDFARGRQATEPQSSSPAPLAPQTP